jgi:hypothetical protein
VADYASANTNDVPFCVTRELDPRAIFFAKAGLQVKPGNDAFFYDAAILIRWP